MSKDDYKRELFKEGPWAMCWEEFPLEVQDWILTAYIQGRADQMQAIKSTTATVFDSQARPL